MEPTLPSVEERERALLERKRRLAAEKLARERQERREKRQKERHVRRRQRGVKMDLLRQQTTPETPAADETDVETELDGLQATEPDIPYEDIGGEAGIPDEDGLARVPTYVTGFDDALDGGIPQGFVVVLEGAPGTLKSSLSLWILARNAQHHGRKGLYVTCEEASGSLLQQARGIGLDLSAVTEHVRILDAPLLAREFRKAKKDWLDALRGAVERVRGDGGLDLLVLDSLDALSVLARFQDRRMDLFRLFEWLRDLGITTFVIAERGDFVVQGNVLQGHHDENFLADGVLHLRLHLISDLDAQRRIRIVKMRATRHETGYMALHIGKGELEVARVLRA